MPFLLFGAVLFVVVMAVVSVMGYRYWVKPAVYMDRVGAQAIPEMGEFIAEEHAPPSGVTRLLSRVGETVPVSPDQVRKQRRKLMAAGYRSESAVVALAGLQIMCAAAFGLGIFFLLRMAFSLAIEQVVAAAVLATVAGYLLPNEILMGFIQSRRQRLRNSLPDALDLMVICVEAGLGLDQAILDVSSELRITHRELSEEFALVNLELRAGKRRAEALRNLAERTGEPELRKLVNILIQTDRFGTSIAQALRTHSDFMRVKRRQIAEEKAAKVGVKLVFPIFFFILPSMFLVTVGPALLQLFAELFPMMQEAK